MPLLARLVPEGLELCGEVAVAGGDAEEDSVEFFEDGGVVEGGDRGVLGGCVHLVEDVLGEGLGDSAGGLVGGLEGDEGGVWIAIAIASSEMMVLGILEREYILEELGVTTRLLDTLQLSIGLAISVSTSSQLSGINRVGSRFATNNSSPSQHHRNIPSS